MNILEVNILGFMATTTLFILVPTSFLFSSTQKQSEK